MPGSGPIINFVQPENNAALSANSDIEIVANIADAGGAAGYRLGGSENIWGVAGHPIDRNNLIVPEVMVEELGQNPYQIMRPIFDAVWNAGGYARDLNYDPSGNWIKS